MTKLESYMLDGHFTAVQFLCDVDGHPEQPPLRRAFEELRFFSREVHVLGCYPAHPYRLGQAGQGAEIARPRPARLTPRAPLCFPPAP